MAIHLRKWGVQKGERKSREGDFGGKLDGKKGLPRGTNGLEGKVQIGRVGVKENPILAGFKKEKIWKRGGITSWGKRETLKRKGKNTE